MAEQLTLAQILRLATTGTAFGDNEGPPAARPGPKKPLPRGVADELTRTAAAGPGPMPPQPTDVPTYVHTLGGQRMVARQPNPQGAPSSVITAAADPLGLTANAPPTVQDQPVHTLSGRERGLSVPVSGGVPQPGPNEQLAGAAFMPLARF